jgi:triacylglycerol lipase
LKGKTLVAVVAAAGAGAVLGERAVQRYYASTPPPSQPLHTNEEPAITPLWRENLWSLDWMSLKMSPVYRGMGVPRGNGDPVVLIPGFLFTDRYLRTLHNWLGRIGYTPHLSAIGRNTDCLDVLCNRLLTTIDRATPGRAGVHLVGHSLGGALALAAAARRLDRVASVTTLGTPVRGLRTNVVAMQIAHLVRVKIHWLRGSQVTAQCYTYACACDTVSCLRAGVPESVSLRSIYSRSDGVVDWRYCLHAEPKLNTEVRSTHLGLVANPQAYRAIAEQLAAARR